MDSPKISFVASSIRPQYWKDMYNSLLSNQLPWEMIMVGPNPGESPGPNFAYIQSHVKPAQCYEIGFRQAKGELLSWTADDAIYSPNAVDVAYNFYKQHPEKTVVAFRTVEDGRDITNVHHFIGRGLASPRMAPFGVMSTKIFRELGGYDQDFICGQSENDVVMRVYESGGTVQVSPAVAIVSHEKAHYQGTVFRSNFYPADRQVLEGAWMEDGKVLHQRKYPVRPFSDENILTITQGQRGLWK